MASLRAALLGAAILFALGGCQPGSIQLTGGVPTPEAQRCAQSGGFLAKRGKRGNLMCVQPFADAGKACTSTKECQGRCLAVDDSGGVPKLGEAAAGICQADDKLFGCFAELEQGKVKSSKCID